MLAPQRGLIAAGEKQNNDNSGIRLTVSFAKQKQPVKWAFHPDGSVVLRPKLPASAIKGMFAGRVDKPVPVEQMRRA